MFQENYGFRNQFEKRFSFNFRGIFLLLVKLFIIAFWLCLPFLLWNFARLDYVAGGYFVKYKPYAIIFLYVTLAYEYLRNSNHFL